jgi:hypothetical protein
VDVRNRLSINGSWDLPLGSGRAIGGDWRGPIQQILGGWSLNGILTASDGNWQSVRIPFNWSRSAQTADVPDRPSLIPGGNQNPVLSEGRDPNRYFDASQFVLGPPGYFGTLGRNTLERPGVFTLDFSLQKNFNFSEQKYLQFRAEMFNITNRAPSRPPRIYKDPSFQLTGQMYFDSLGDHQPAGMLKLCFAQMESGTWHVIVTMGRSNLLFTI